ncbi:MAG: type II toxin-antitoxin system mRNA interferase toxin, RelE/StbE family [Calditrichaeota bacterium]|nr:MAG: type II toxin-antitoxin system mRNA interferase toxin, RelE/StbE family [Calditrichota bacterium]
MEVEFRKSFLKDLKKCKQTEILKRVKNIIEEIETYENFKKVKNLKPLQGSSNFYRIRVGDFRIGIKFYDDSIIFIRMLHRKDIYRFFP